MKKTEGKKINYELLLKRLENEAIKSNTNSSLLSQVVERKDVWSALPIKEALRLSELVAALGKVKTAKKILDYYGNLYPNSEDIKNTKRKLFGNTMLLAYDTAYSDDNAIIEPFVKYRYRKELIKLYMDTFKGREDCFARQWSNRSDNTSGYVPVRHPMTEKDLEEHLKGSKTYGIYLLNKNNQVYLGVIDMDLKRKFLNKAVKLAKKKEIIREMKYIIKRLPEIAREQELSCICEFSGNKGYHFWFIMEEAVPASLLRKALTALIEKIRGDLEFFNLEVFPKQDRLAGKGLGNLVKLPLGIHRLTGKPSFFLGASGRDEERQLEFLKTVKRISREAVEKFAKEQRRSSGVVISYQPHKEWAEKHPELVKLSEHCPVLSLIFKRCSHGIELTTREEKVLFGTLAFLKRGRTLLHYLFSRMPDYNPHLVDYRISTIRGTPLGCRKIHRLLDVVDDFCAFEKPDPYPHPLLHLPEWLEEKESREVMAERVQNLESALELLKRAIIAVEQFLYPGTKK